MWFIHGAEDDLCTQYEGQIWEDGASDEKFPEVDTHPNCKCTREKVDEVGNIL